MKASLICIILAGLIGYLEVYGYETQGESDASAEKESAPSNGLSEEEQHRQSAMTEEERAERNR